LKFRIGPFETSQTCHSKELFAFYFFILSTCVLHKIHHQENLLITLNSVELQICISEQLRVLLRFMEEHQRPVVKNTYLFIIGFFFFFLIPKTWTGDGSMTMKIGDASNSANAFQTSPSTNEASGIMASIMVKVTFIQF
jgi:hypothetical protein